FYRGVVCDDHEFTPADRGDARDGSGGRSAAPFFVHFVSGVEAKLKKCRAFIVQFLDAFARSEAAFFVLRFVSFGAAAFAVLLFFILDLRQKLDDAAGVLFEVGRFAVDVGAQSGRRHAASSETTRRSLQYTVSRKNPRASVVTLRKIDECTLRWLWDYSF